MEFTEWDTRLGAYAVITDEHGRILLTWSSNARSPSLWTLPGGAVEFEESPEEAVVREVHEETGYHVSVGRPLFCRSATARVGNRSPRPFKEVRIVFDTTIIGGELGTVEIGGTTVEARWIPLAALRDHEPREPVVDEAHQHLRQVRDG